MKKKEIKSQIKTKDCSEVPLPKLTQIETILTTKRTEAPLDSQERFNIYSQRSNSKMKNDSFESNIPEEFVLSMNNVENNNEEPINNVQNLASNNSRSLSRENLSSRALSKDPYLKSFRTFSEKMTQNSLFNQPSHTRSLGLKESKNNLLIRSNFSNETSDAAIGILVKNKSSEKL